MPSILFSIFFFLTCVASVDVPGRAFNRFISIWLENQVSLPLSSHPFLLKLTPEDYSKVSVNSDITDLAKQGILLTEYFGLTHPSQPNYIASVGGDYFGLNSDDFIRIPENVSTVVDLFDTKGITWSGYFEGLPGPGYMGAGSTGRDGVWDYVRKHK
jgi:acid phosphatase